MLWVRVPSAIFRGVSLNGAVCRKALASRVLQGACASQRNGFDSRRVHIKPFNLTYGGGVMNVQRSNLMSAIAIAIRAEEEANRRANQTWESAFLVGLRELLGALERGEHVIVDGIGMCPKCKILYTRNETWVR